MRNKTTGLGIATMVALTAVVGCSTHGTAPDSPGTAGVGDPNGAPFAWSENGAEELGQTHDVPEPFSHEFGALIPQTVRWGALDVKTAAVRQIRGQYAIDNPDLPAGSLQLRPDTIYVEIEIELTNKGSKEVFVNLETWALVLGDGSRQQPVGWPAVQILPPDSTTKRLHYRVAQEVDLAGASLQLNGESNQEPLEPESVPFDVPYAPTFPRRIVSVVGQTFSNTAGNMDFEIDEAIYDVNYGRHPLHALNDTRIVWLELAATSRRRRGDFLDTGNCRLIVDGRGQSPFDDRFASIENGAASVLPVAFSIPEEATTFTIMIPDGSDEGKRFDVRVEDTELALDLP